MHAEYPVERSPREKPAADSSAIALHPGKEKQVITGLGFEIQSDSINSGNEGFSNDLTSVPHDLTPEERERLYRDMLKGFRYCRLAGGLYWRGLDPEQKTFQGRWPEQMAELKELVTKTGVEGLSLEYWSPAPFWKANRKFTGKDGSENILRCFGKDFANDPDYRGDVDHFLRDFAEANRLDLQTLKDAGLPVTLWGLQNEPWMDAKYSSCSYTPQQYARTFLAVAPAVRGFDPKIEIIADSAGLEFIQPALETKDGAALVDAFVIHHVGSDSKDVESEMKSAQLARQYGKPLFQNEYEYLKGPASPARCLNTVQHLMNWFQLADAPTWFWIHALKPYKNQEASGYSLGFWRPANDTDPALDSHYKGLQPGHWTWNPYNWNAVGSFLRHMPWDCRSVAVTEETPDHDLRVLAFKRPDGKLTFVLSNRSGKPHTFRVTAGRPGAVFKGFRYTPDETGLDFRGVEIGAKTGETLSIELADLSWEFWEEQ